MKTFLLIIGLAFCTTTTAQLPGEYLCDRTHVENGDTIHIMRQIRNIHLKEDHSYEITNIFFRWHYENPQMGKWEVKGDTLYLVRQQYEHLLRSPLSEEEKRPRKLLVLPDGRLKYVGDVFWEGWVFSRKEENNSH